MVKFTKYVLFAYIFILAQLLANAGEQIPPAVDSLNAAFLAEKNIEEKGKLYHDLSRALITSDLSRATALALEGIEFAKKNNLQHRLATLYNAVAVSYIYSGKNEWALAYMDSAITLYRIENDPVNLANTLGNKGSVYYMIGNYNLSLDYQLQCLEVVEKYGYEPSIATTLTNMLGIYYVQKDYDRALESARKAYSIFYKLNDYDNLGLTTHNLGTVFLETGDIDSAYHYANASLNFYTKSQNPEGIADANRFMGDVKLKQGNLDEALDHTKYAIDTFEKIGGIHKLTETYLLLSSIYLQKKEYNDAIKFALQVIDLSSQIGTRHLRRDAYKKMMECYEQQGQFAKYHEYAKLFLPLKDSILDEENLRAQKESVIRFETQQKEKENAELKLKDELQKEKIAKQNIYLFIAIISIILILAVAYFVIRKNQSEAKSKTYKLEQELLRTQMNPHFIFNALTAIQSFVYKREPKEAGKYLSSFAVLIRNILDHSRADYITLVKEISWLENYLEVQKLRFENNFEYEIIVDKELIPENTLIPPMLTQPFIENALEHGFQDLSYMGKLLVTFTKAGRSLVVEINDNGKGFSTESSASHTPMGTSITRERIEILNKRSKLPIEFSISEKTSGGVVVKFKIPLEDI